jgi:CubicO group peptidase (beta-lactamase class C family)
VSRVVLTYLPVVFGVSILAPAPVPHPDRTADLRTSIDSLVTAQIAADSFSGVVLVAENGKTIYERAAGQRDRQTGAPITPDTKFQIASTTKLFTQIAVRQLEQQGRLSLSDTLGKFLPEYPNAVARSKVTVDQLLNHRSGIGSFWNARFMARHEQVRAVRDYVELFKDDSLLFPPGTSQAYSNGGYVLLGAIIERVSGQTYHEYLRDHVFRPAGMRNTVPYERGVAVANAAIGYTAQQLGPVSGDSRRAGTGSRPGYESHVGGRGETRHPNTDFQPGMSGPAGDGYSTVEDFVGLAHALTTHLLLDSARTVAVLGPRYASGGEFRANGGGPGVNAELSIFASGDVVVVLSNYDPPAATAIAQFIRERVASTKEIR